MRQVSLMSFGEFVVGRKGERTLEIQNYSSDGQIKVAEGFAIISRKRSYYTLD